MAAESALIKDSESAKAKGRVRQKDGTETWEATLKIRLLPGGGPDGDPNRTFRGDEVEQRARLLTKPEPQYTEEARKNQISGTVPASRLSSADR